ncbi:phospholipase/carboxylesterase [Aspergillus costaricaensis CBS 115574]|uniref:Phospholipase/carboxylesterase n=1 Tax=Aspergillus costaricaensis CBS 115574 TaxID=1448317 RepID=A0ACD1I3E5_9EURO|nr:phospholipase/carboxylesterase [Aspergillus costaricaensis CBS 115574]RAK84886.1 phospholipase/carboxylesterase [Aspergillus costaricaensis CBS 115574]
MFPPAPRPRIACFHGGGSKGEIYKIQCSRLASLLENDFEFVFFDGPYTRDAGPGVLPAFRGYEPYKSWVTNDSDGKELVDGSGYDDVGRDGIERVLKLMVQNDREQDEPAGPWVGAMGFSQGTRMVGGLLLDQQRRAASGWDANEGIQLKFGVCCMGAGAPLESEVSKHFNFEDSTVSLPTLHVHGLKDWVLPLSRLQYAKYYDSKTKKLYEVDYHHAMPWNTHEVQKLADLIRQIYKENA